MQNFQAWTHRGGASAPGRAGHHLPLGSRGQTQVQEVPGARSEGRRCCLPSMAARAGETRPNRSGYLPLDCSSHSSYGTAARSGPGRSAGSPPIAGCRGQGPRLDLLLAASGANLGQTWAGVLEVSQGAGRDRPSSHAARVGQRGLHFQGQHGTWSGRHRAALCQTLAGFRQK